MSSKKVSDSILSGIRNANRQKDKNFASTRPTKYRRTLYISSMSYCARRWGFQELLQREKSSFSDDTLLIFADGDATETTLVTAVMNSDDFVVTELQKSVTTVLEGFDTEARGRIDVEGHFAGPDEPVFPIEIKSMNSRNFALAATFGSQLSHKKQLSFYITLTDAPFGRLLYKEKNSSQMQEFQIDRSDADELVEIVKSQYAGAIQAVEAQDLLVLPGLSPKELTSADECKYCGYSVECLRATKIASLEEVSDTTPPW